MMSRCSFEERPAAISRYCQQAGWGEVPLSPDEVTFLAAGEYNENWLLPEGFNEQRAKGVVATSGMLPEEKGTVEAARSGNYVFRINHGSQLGLGKRQITYEFRVLELLADSRVTPRVYQADAAPNAVEPSLDGGVLLMDHLDGGPLQYERDITAAAHIFAAVHSCPVPESHGLIIQADPVGDIVAECDGLLARFPDHPRKDVHHALSVYRDSIVRLGEESLPLFAAEPLVIANTEVNSGNFCIVPAEENGHTGYAGLVDWEKAVVTCRYQDLGHFLVPTTTLWKSSYTFTDEKRREFISAYRDALLLRAEQDSTTIEVPDTDDLIYKTDILERTILLRGLCWCYMAWYEYTRQGKTLQHTDTFGVIERYLDEIEWFLQ